jgi:hypothetical protein
VDVNSSGERLVLSRVMWMDVLGHEPRGETEMASAVLPQKNSGPNVA